MNTFLEFVREEKLATGLIVFIVAILGICVWGSVLVSQGKARCAEKGWPDARVHTNGEVYCVARIDNSDVVRRLEDAEQR